MGIVITVAGLLALPGLLSGCGTEATKATEPVVVDVTLTTNSIAIERVVPATSRLIARGHGERDIRFELRDSEGELITAGVVSDPRLKRFEAMNEDGTATVELEDTGAGEVAIRLPSIAGELAFYEPSADGSHVVEIGRTAFDPGGRLETTRQLRARHAAAGNQDSFCSISDGESSCATLIAGSGSSVLNVDFVFVAAGFSAGEMGDFRSAARQVTQEILASGDLGKYGSRLNFWTLDDPGSTEAIDDPRYDDDVDGDLKRKDNGYPEWNGGFRNRMMDRVRFLDAEAVVIIARSRRCGEGCTFQTTNADGVAETHGRCLGADDVGYDDSRADNICYNWGGVANSGKGFTVGNEGDPNLAHMLIHEVGHAYFDLGDEYGVDGSTGCGDRKAMNTARRFKNLTLNGDAMGGVVGNIFEGLGSLAGAKDVWWDDMITIDTPDADFDAYPNLGYDLDALQSEIGKFVGGGTCRRKIMRGQLECRMKWHPDNEWCDVCARLVKEKFDDWQEDAGDDGVCPRRWDGDGICDPCLGDDSDCCSFAGLWGTGLAEHFQCLVRYQSCGDGVCDVIYGEDDDNCAEDCNVGVCGNGLCEGLEASPGAWQNGAPTYCGEDCGCGSVDVSTDVAPTGCFCGPDCAEYGDCCADACDVFGNGC